MPIKHRDLLEHLQHERAVKEKSLYAQFGKRLVLDALHAGTITRSYRDYVTITPKGKQALSA
jgi:hypothetical protein